MPLIELMLTGIRDRVQIAIDRLRNFEPDEGYYLAFSGGKDSVTILRLAEMAGVKFDAHYNVTTVDPPELVQFIKKQHPDVERHRPEMTMFQLIRYKHWPPMRKQRYCCEWLKEKGGEGRFVVTGVRWAESPRRKLQRGMLEQCATKHTRTLNPIIDWSDADVWEFIRQEDVPYCSLYDEGFTRLGCVLCPLGSNQEKEAARWPKIATAYLNTFDRLIEIRKAIGKKQKFETGQELFDWWIGRMQSTNHPDEQMTFDDLDV